MAYLLLILKSGQLVRTQSAAAAGEGDTVLTPTLTRPQSEAPPTDSLSGDGADQAVSRSQRHPGGGEDERRASSPGQQSASGPPFQQLLVHDRGNTSKINPDIPPKLQEPEDPSVNVGGSSQRNTALETPTGRGLCEPPTFVEVWALGKVCRPSKWPTVNDPDRPGAGELGRFPATSALPGRSR